METKKPTPRRKYYLAFVLFAQDSITHETLQLHCTHKYLGEQNDNAMGAVCRITQKFFDKPRHWPLALFNERVWFHGDKVYKIQPNLDGESVSVLKSYIRSEVFFPELRAELEQFRADDFPDYIPHITVENYPSVSGQFQCYALMSGEEILAYWRNPQWEQSERAAQDRQARLEKGTELKPISSVEGVPGQQRVASVLELVRRSKSHQ